MRTFPDLLRERALGTPDKVAYRFFQGEHPPATLSYLQLWEQVASMALLIEQRGLAGTRILLLFKSQQHFAIAFLACLAAGATAVPTAVPRRQHLAGRMQVLLADADVSAVLSDCKAAEVGTLVEQLPWLDLPAMLAPGGHAIRADAWRAPQLAGQALAFLQYTSGSTGDPKGVMVSHANLIHNGTAIAQGMALGADSIVFTALPLFHDMGLVGGLLQALYCGCEANFMAPAEFVQYPERWLKTMSALRATTSGGPNIMFDLAARAIAPEQLDGVDLSAWTVAFCGAEPIRPATMAAFRAKFAPWGFKPTAFFPCYGMAEATLYLSGKAPLAMAQLDDSQGVNVVGCGVAARATELAIVDPDTCRALPDGAVGEIWASGPGIATGYWRRPSLTEQVFHAELAGDPSRRFLRTGDLGYLREGQLYVSGRRKDLIIVYGRKYAPQDIEASAEAAHPALARNGSAAFAVHDGQRERVVMFAELGREWLRRQHEWEAIASAVRSAISAEHAIKLDELVWLKPGALARTSSGKVRRSACRVDYENGDIERLRAPQPALAD